MGKTPKYIIRKMQEKDVDGVYAVECDVFTSPWPKNLFEKELEMEFSTYLIIEHEGVICAYAGFWFIIDEAQVTNIAVRKAYQGKGIGRQLVEALIFEAVVKGADSMFLEVRASNERAQVLYKSLGFTEYGIRNAYYADNGEDAMLMRKDL